jgi:hypothetical protein
MKENSEAPETQNEAFMSVTSRKILEQDKKIEVIQTSMNQLRGNENVLQDYFLEIKALYLKIEETFQVNEQMLDLSEQLEKTCQKLQQPAISQQVHHHHFPKIFFATVGLFWAVCLVSSGWYVTDSKLNDYVANDTKYRLLQLDTSNRNIKKYLAYADSMYKSTENLRKLVIEKEEEQRKNIEKLIRANQLKAEAKNLEREVILKSK